MTQEHLIEGAFLSKVAEEQSMTPIDKIEIAIAIPIPIFLRNWDRDPDLNLKKYLRSDRDRSSANADLLSVLLKYFMQKLKFT